jgi:membrane complex biogenesis BtpA family protein
MRNLPPKSLIAMIALRALPGSPLYDGDDQKIIDAALADLEEYKKCGVDSIMIENDFDIPYIKPPIDQEAVDLVKRIGMLLRKQFDKPLGVQLLEGAGETSLEIAHECDFDYIRVESYVYAHVGAAGIIEGSAGKLLRLRKKLNAAHIKIFTDVKKKHCSHSLTSDLDIVDEVKQAELFMVDGIIVTGKFTGLKPNIEDLHKVKKSTKLPVLIGSGMTKENIKEYFPLADAFIVGSTFRKDGQFLAELDSARLQEFVTIFNQERERILS